MLPPGLCHILLALWTLNFGFLKYVYKLLRWMALNSDNIIVRTITNVGLNGTHSVMGGN